MFNTIVETFATETRIRFFKNLIFTHEKPFERRRRKNHVERSMPVVTPTPFEDDDGKLIMAKKVLDFEKKDAAEFKVAESIRCSLSRTRNKIYRIAMSYPDWKYFVTFTFDPGKVDRYDYDDVVHKFGIWLKKFASAHDLVYIVIPEKHADGAYHFHGLFSGNLPVEFAGNFKKTGETYHVAGYNLGFTTALPVKSVERVSKYITSYITKDLVAVSKYRKRYWYSRSKIEVKEPYRFMANPDVLKYFITRVCNLLYSAVNIAEGTQYEYDEFFVDNGHFEEIYEYVFGVDVDGCYFDSDSWDFCPG